MSIEFDSRAPRVDPEATPLRRLGDAMRDGLALFFEAIAALPIPLPTRLLDRLDERLARARRAAFGRRSCVLSWQREPDGSWRARLSAPDLVRTIERSARTRTFAILRAARVLRRTREFHARQAMTL